MKLSKKINHIVSLTVDDFYSSGKTTNMSHDIVDLDFIHNILFEDTQKIKVVSSIAFNEVVL